MKTFNDNEISQAHSAIEEISSRLEAIRQAKDHPILIGQSTDQLTEFLRRTPGHGLINLVHEVLDAQIEQTIAEFIQATERFFLGAADLAKRAAETTPAVNKLQHDRNVVGETPSPAIAEIILGALQQFVASPAVNGAEAHTTE